VDKSILAMTLANIVARMERSEIRDSRDAGPGLRFAPSGLQPLTIRPAQVICPSGSFLTGLSSLISDFPKNISVPTYRSFFEEDGLPGIGERKRRRPSDGYARQ
jgi:hypothetical protein